MASLVAECLRFLELLVSTYRVTRRASRTLLLEASRDQLMCIAEVVVNTLEGNLTISTRPQQELARFKKVLRKVARILDGTSRTAIKTQAQTSSDSESSRVATQTQVNSHSHSQSSFIQGRNRPAPQLPSNYNRRRTSVSSRKALRQLYVQHYAVIVEFLELCLPHLKLLVDQ